MNGSGPGPVAVETDPSSDDSGHDGLACSTRPACAPAEPSWASEHSPTPEIFPSSPVGSDTVNPAKPSSESCFEKDSTNGENPPAWLVTVPAVKDGVKPFTQPLEMLKLSDGVASGAES